MAKHGFTLTHIFPYKDRIGYSLLHRTGYSNLILENSGQIKTAFCLFYALVNCNSGSQPIQPIKGCEISSKYHRKISSYSKDRLVIAYHSCFSENHQTFAKCKTRVKFSS